KVLASEPAVLAQGGERDKDNQAQEIQQKRQEIERAHAELRQMQQQLERMKQELQRKAQSLEEMARRFAEAERTAQANQEREEEREPDAKFPDSPFGKEGGGGGTGRFGGDKGGGGGAGGDVNRRLDALEHKLDRVLRELENLRQQQRSKNVPQAIAPPSA